MQIYVTMTNGKTICVDVPIEKMTVQDLKQKLMEKSSIQVVNMIVMFKGKILEDDKKLAAYGIEKEARLEQDTLTSYSDKMMKRVESAEQEAQMYQARFIDEQEKNQQMRDDLTTFNKQIQTLTLQKSQAEGDAMQLKNQITQMQSKLEENLMRSSVSFGETSNSKAIQFAELNTKVQMMELDLADKVGQIDYFKEEKRNMQLKLDEMSKMKEELTEKKYEVKALEREIQYLKDRGSSTQTDLSKELDQYKELYKQKEQESKELAKKVQTMELEQIKVQYSQKDDQAFKELQNKLAQTENRAQEYMVQIKSLNQQINNLQNMQTISQSNLLSSVHDSGKKQLQERIFELESQVKQLEAELTAKTQAFQNSQVQLSQAKQQIFEFNRKSQEFESSIDGLKALLKQKERTIMEKDAQIKNHQFAITDLNKDIELYKQNTDTLKKVSISNPAQLVEFDNNFMANDDLIRKREEQRKREERQRREEEDRNNAERLKQMSNEQLKMQDLMKKDKAQRQKTAQFLKKQMMETHGKIEVCFLIDVTASMDPYKDQAMRCISESIKSIKVKTNRDALWAAVAYQDFGELKQLGGLYKQINFTANPQEVEKFLRDQPCVGGGDYAEDIRGGIKQMVQNLSWSKTFKIALLICDAPTHGKRYNAGVGDRYPNEDIEDAIKLMIEANILFVGIVFNKITMTMFEEVRKIYQSYDREELLLFADLANTEEGKIWQELVDLVSQASMRATQTNNKGTKSKLADANKRSQSGAMEALCKLIKNPIEFDKQPGVKVIQADFQVIRVEIKQEAFEANIENIKNITHKDCATYREGEWKCVRTQTYFAQGQMKQVFLMKKQNNPNELYVIKMPIGDKTYGSLDQAINECRSHLIAKCLMKKFVREIADIQKIPEPQYSDFLVLQDKPNSFWIAERYFQGEFVKYNNNYGYISDDNAQINHLAQAFTYYTYFISNFKYMISDVQGVGLYFTDPAINTVEGNFDETDMGVDGQSMFMVSYEGKKHIGAQFLELLKIKLE